MSVKKLHFEAAAQYRISQEDLEKGRSVASDALFCSEKSCADPALKVWRGNRTAAACRIAGQEGVGGD